MSLLNQSVLLKQVNDNVAALLTLSHALIQANVMPYYLHLLDPVTGAQHFQVNKDRAVDLIEQMKRRCAGYLVPKLVQEIPGDASKRDIVPT